MSGCLCLHKSHLSWYYSFYLSSQSIPSSAWTVVLWYLVGLARSHDGLSLSASMQVWPWLGLRIVIWNEIKSWILPRILNPRIDILKSLNWSRWTESKMTFTIAIKEFWSRWTESQLLSRFQSRSHNLLHLYQFHQFTYKYCIFPNFCSQWYNTSSNLIKSVLQQFKTL